MSVSSQSKSDHILEALHECPEAHSELMLTIHWSVMSQHDGQTVLSLNLHQLLFQPFNLMSRVVSFAPNIKVQHVTCVRVVGNKSRACWQALTILESANVHRIVSVFAILFISLLIKPFAPVFLDMVDRVV